MKKITLLFTIIFLLIPSFVFIKNVNYISPLLGQIIFIDPGHGGKDNGTSFDNILEDEINLKICKLMFETFINEGAICYISRNSDYDLSDMYSKNHKLDDLKKRVNYIDSLNSTLFISMHLNSYPSPLVNGIQVFYQKDNEKSKILANILQSKLNTLNNKDKPCKVGDYYLLNNTTTTGVLIEYGFLSNNEDRKKLLNDKYLQKIINKIKDSLYEYLK